MEFGADCLQELRATSESAEQTSLQLAKRRSPWHELALADLIAGREQRWFELYEDTEAVISELRSLLQYHEHVNAALPDGVSREQLMSDATDLAAYLEAGGRVGVWPFQPECVRRTRYLWSGVRFDGRLANNVNTLNALVGSIKEDVALDRLWTEWAAHARIESPNGTFRLRLSAISEHVASLTMLLEFVNLWKTARTQLGHLSVRTGALAGVDRPTTLLAEIDLALAVCERQRLEASLLNLVNAVTEWNSNYEGHPAVERLEDAADNRNVAAYESSYLEIQAFAVAKQIVQLHHDLDAELRQYAPKFAESLRRCETREMIRPFLERLPDAWNWKRAVSWLERFCNEHDDGVGQQIHRLEDQLRKMTGEFAAEKAWKLCVSRLKSAELTAMRAWHKLQTKDIGKGAGKLVETARREARENLQRCKGAIPCWVMPLHRVVEQIEMVADSFDVVIVDEASQTGPEGLLLLLLGKKCVIVGDDKQISPDLVGIPVAEVRMLMKKWLGDVPQPQALKPTYSLFDQADIWFGEKITLTEHFRCMPEIIRFSDANFYSREGTPLQPLRQYPPKRLAPIMVRYVKDGYREGKTNPTNDPEARCLVKSLIDCLSDPRYAGKTLGVISLQGYAQAKLIESMILEVVGAKPFSERRLVCGDPYSFQGDERDVIFLSMVAAISGETRVTPLTRPTFQQRFNVAASRARDQMWLFHSIHRDDIDNPDCMRRRLLDHCYNPTKIIADCDLSVCDSDFERHVATILLDRRYRVVPQFEMAGKFIDLVVEGPRGRLAIECDGDEFHGPDDWEKDMIRQRQLERCGLVFVRIRGCRFYANRLKAMAPVFARLEELEIKPISIESIDQNQPRDWVAEVSSKDCPLTPAVSPMTETPRASIKDTKKSRSVVSKARQGNFARNLFGDDEEIETASVKAETPRNGLPVRASFTKSELEWAAYCVVKESTGPVWASDVFASLQANSEFAGVAESEVEQALEFFRGKMLRRDPATKHWTTIN
jgi:very-short-patch-repair endonuclease